MFSDFRQTFTCDRGDERRRLEVTRRGASFQRSPDVMRPSLRPSLDLPENYCLRANMTFHSFQKNTA